MPRNAYRSLRLVLVANGTVDVLIGAMLLVYPQVVPLLAPQLSINYIAERVTAAALLSTGGANFYAWRYTERDQFVELLAVNLVWSLGVVLGFIVTAVQRPELVSLFPVLFIGSFAVDACTYTSFLSSFPSRGISPEEPVPSGHHQTLRIAMLAHAIIDLLVAGLFLGYPEIIELAAPQLSINYFAERSAAAALFAIGVASLYAWRFTAQRQFTELLVRKVIWSSSVVLGFLATIVQRPDLLSLLPLLFMAFFVVGSGTWSGFLLAYCRVPVKHL